MRILHTESSRGWGGQELRVLNEAAGMLARGENPAIAAAIVKDQGACLEQGLPSVALDLYGDQALPGTSSTAVKISR